MFSFSGFSSFAPYLIYLSLIWIYILFGFLEKNWTLIHPKQVNQHITFVKEKQVKTGNSSLYYIGKNHILKKSFRSTSYYTSESAVSLDIYKRLPVVVVYKFRCGFLHYYLWRGPPPSGLA
jgi:hypothetical protein